MSQGTTSVVPIQLLLNFGFKPLSRARTEASPTEEAAEELASRDVPAG